MADLRISELAALAGANLSAGDLLPVVDISASETKKITVTDLVGNATTLIADATIPGAKILFGSQQVAGTALVNGAVGTTQLADDAVTAAKLGNESTVDLVTTLPASGAFVGQLALDTGNLKVYCWNGSTWQSIKAAGSINTVSGSGTGIVNVTVTTSGDTITISTTLDDTAAAAQFLAGPTGAAGTVGYRTIVGTDLPVPTTTTKGAVVVNGEGLRMDGSVLEVDNDVTARTTHSVVTHNAKGLITGSRAITSTDLPAATNSEKGAVIAGSGLAVSSGTLNHSNTVVAGTGTKVSFDAQGHVTATTTLADTDIPNISAVKLTSGTLDMARIGTNAITGPKLANSSIVKFGGAGSTAGVVTFPTADFQGQYFFDSLNGDLYLYDGTAWKPITITAGELIYAGTYNAATNTVKSVTAAGTAAGLVVSAALPAASSNNLRYYVVVSDSGNGTAPAPAVALAPPDMLVSGGSSWELIDVSNGIAGQLASNISFTPYGGIAAVNVQTALQELEDDKLNKTGGTITGPLEIGTTGSLVFEGSSADANETTLAVVNPTADRTVTIPDVTGTIVTTGDTGTVSNAMLATISTAGKVSNSATTATSANTASAIVARDSSGNFAAGQITSTGGLIGTSTALTNVYAIGTALTPGVQIEGNTGNAAALSITRHTSAAANLILQRGVTGTPVIDADAVGQIGFNGFDGANYFNAALIRGVVDGTPSTGSMPGRLSLQTTPTGSTTPVERLRIGPAGQIMAAALGTAALPIWSFTGDPNTGLFSLGADQVAISTGGTGRLFVDASGNVGVGTSTPDAYGKLAVIGSGDIGVFSNATNSDLRINIGTSISSITNTQNAPISIGTNNAERLRIDSSGRLLVGTSTSRSVSGAERLVQIEGTDASNTHLSITRNSNDALQASVFLNKSRGSTNGSVTAVSPGDAVGSIVFSGADGASLVAAALIRGEVDGTPGANDMPGRLVFSTTADGASSPTERMRITSAGLVGIGTTSPGENLSIAGGANLYASITSNGGIKTALSSLDGSSIGWVGTVSNHGFALFANNAERARIDSSGRLLVGTSTARSVATQTWQTQQEGTSFATTGISTTRNSADVSGSYLAFGKSRGTTIGSSTVVSNGDELGALVFAGADGTDLNSYAALIKVEVDGTPALDDMPGRIVLSTTLDGASAPTEALRITNDRVVCYNQPDVTSKSTAATLTIAELKTGIIQYTGNAQTLTLPTGTLMEGGFSGIYTNMTFEWSVINTGSGTCTIGAGTAHTIVGGATVAAGDSGRFASRRTAANTFVSYRLS